MRPRLRQDPRPSRDYTPYDPASVETRVYEEWLRQGLFKPKSEAESGGRRPFVITMPPPNVTGELHIGHAMFVTIEDILTRWHRMLGDPTLWVPGRDHAGIAGQLVVERELATGGADAPRPRPREVPGAGLGLDGPVRQADPLPDVPARRFG